VISIFREKRVCREEEEEEMTWKDIQSRCIRLSLAFWTWLLHVRVDGGLWYWCRVDLQAKYCQRRCTDL
jgi:hypothetical protein